VITRRDKASPGFTLVELLVVMSVFLILAALAVPAISRSGVFSRDEMKSTARELQSLLRTAQIYASTYHRNTAVVYMMDNYRDVLVDPENTPGLSSPIVDSITGENVRFIIGAAIMFQPTLDDRGMRVCKNCCMDCFVPINHPEGEFMFFPGNMGVLMRDPATADPKNGNPLIIYDDRHVALEDRRPRFYCEDNAVEDPDGIGCGGGRITYSGISYLGMRDVPVVVKGPPIDDDLPNIPFISVFPAHVFTPSGRMDIESGCESLCIKTKERYEIIVTPLPSDPLDERLIDDNEIRMIIYDSEGAPTWNLYGIRIELFRSTGRVRIMS